jgi:hypothetical protein
MYALIHFIAWPLLIYLAYVWIKYAIRKYGRELEKNF